MDSPLKLKFTRNTIHTAKHGRKSFKTEIKEENFSFLR